MDDRLQIHRVKIRRLNDEIANLQAQRHELLRQAIAEGLAVQDPGEQTSFEVLRRKSRRRLTMHIALAVAGVLLIVGALIFSDFGTVQPSVSVSVLVAFAGSVLMGTSVGAAARTVRAHLEHF